MLIQMQKHGAFIIPHTFSTRCFQESARICKTGSTFAPIGPTGGLCQGVTLILRKLDVSAVLHAAYLRMHRIDVRGTAANRLGRVNATLVRFRRIGLNVHDVPLSYRWLTNQRRNATERFSSSNAHFLRRPSDETRTKVQALQGRIQKKIKCQWK